MKIGPRRPDGAARPGRAGRHAGRRRPGDAGLRPGRADRHQLHHRHRRPHARRRLRLADPQVRPDDRQPRLAPTSSRPRASWSGRARRRTPTSSGRSAAAAAISASSPPSSSGSIRSGPRCFSGLVVHPFDEARDTARGTTASVAREAPDELTVWAVMRKAPPLPFLPGGLARQGGAGRSPPAMPARHGGGREGGGAAARARASRSPTCVGPHPVRRLAAGLRPAADAGRAQLLEVARLHRAFATRRSTPSSTPWRSCRGRNARSSSPRSAARWRASRPTPRPTRTATPTSS